MTVANNDNTRLNCPILLSPIKVPVMTGCGHVCEKSALDAWVGSQPSQVGFPQCPTCHAPMDLTEFVEGEEITVAGPQVFMPKINTPLAQARVTPTPVARLECPISQAPIVSPVMTACGHIFESANLNTWINTPRNNGAQASCPMCRTLIDSAELMQGEDLTDDGLQEFIPKVIVPPVVINTPPVLPRPRPQPTQQSRCRAAGDANIPRAVPIHTPRPHENFANPALMFSSFARAVQHGTGLIDSIMNPGSRRTHHIDHAGGMFGLIFRSIFSTFETVFKVCAGIANLVVEEEQATRRNRFD